MSSSEPRDGQKREPLPPLHRTALCRTERVQVEAKRYRSPSCSSWTEPVPRTRRHSPRLPPPRTRASHCRVSGPLDTSAPRRRGQKRSIPRTKSASECAPTLAFQMRDPLWPLALHQGLEPLILRRSRREVLPRPCALVLNVVLYCITTATGQPRTLPAKRISVIGPGPPESLFQRGDDLAQPISRAERPCLTKQVLRAATTLAMGHLSQIETLEGIPVARRSNRHTALPFRSGPAF